MCFIFYLSSRQTTGIHSVVVNRFYILKTFHLVEYAILAILLFYATLSHFSTILIAYLFSITDEYHQLFTSGRSGRLYDTLYDLIGVAIGLIIILTIKSIFSLKNTQK